MDYVNLAIERMFRLYTNDVPLDNVNLLRKCAIIKTVPKNGIIHHLDEKSIYIYFICSGLVRSYYIDNQGNDITHFFMKENEFCCSELIIKDISSYLCYEALEDVELLCIPICDLMNLISESELCKNLYIKLLEDSLCYKIAREWGFLSKSATERYLDFIHNNKDLEKRVHQFHLASYLGITPVSLSRIKRTIKEES